jgi:cytochrome c oxidase subunit 3
MQTLTTIKNIKTHKEDQFTSYLGMLIALGSFSMLFVALLASYGILRSRSAIWMSYTIGTIPLFLAWVNTVVILISSITLFMASKANERENKILTLNQIYTTIIIGLVFLSLQIILWNVLINDDFTITSHQAGSVFYMLSGLHGLHILGGIISLIWLVFKIRVNNLILKPMRLVSMFWHYLTIVWVVIFLTVIII